MSKPIAQVNYEILKGVMKDFQQESENVTKLHYVTRQKMDTLQSGWAGSAADAFYAEMEGRLLPGIERLSHALHTSGTILNQIVKIFYEADEETIDYYKGFDSLSVGGAYRFSPTLSPEPVAQDGDLPFGYLDPDNVGSTSQERVESLQQFLSTTEGGRDVAAWLNEYGVTVQFGDLDGAIANCSPNGKVITIGTNYAHLSDYALAAVLVHEGTHSLDSHPLDNDSVPLVAPVFNWWYNIQDDFMYVTYPYPEEYRAFRAEAEFWLEVRDQAPPEPIEDDSVDLIFNPDGTYRDVDDVYMDLHDKFGYQGVFNPVVSPEPVPQPPSIPTPEPVPTSTPAPPPPPASPGGTSTPVLPVNTPTPTLAPEPLPTPDSLS